MAQGQFAIYWKLLSLPGGLVSPEDSLKLIDYIFLNDFHAELATSWFENHGGLQRLLALTIKKQSWNTPQDRPSSKVTTPYPYRENVFTARFFSMKIMS